MKNELPHGGDWAGYEQEYGKSPLDFSMNVNPLGISPVIAGAIAAAAQQADRYPDPLCRQLAQRLAEHEQVPPSQIFCGNGAADIIYRLAHALKPMGDVKSGDGQTPSIGRPAQTLPMRSAAREHAGDRHLALDSCLITPKRRPVLLVTAPTFSEYEAAFEENGWEVQHYDLQAGDGFRIREDILAAIGRQTDVVFLCEPNNPTGVTTAPQLLGQILDRCRQTDTTLVVDECFNGFLADPAAHSLTQALRGRNGQGMTDEGACFEPSPQASDTVTEGHAHPADQGSGGLVILKAFTKLYGMAGVRLGYCLCENAALVDRIRRAGPPWNVSSLAQAAGIAALEEEKHVEAGLAILREEGPWLRTQLEELGLGPVYGEANYLLFHAEEGMDVKLRRRGILIRDCSNYAGLGPGWYRIAVRTHEENAILMKAIKEECKR